MKVHHLGAGEMRPLGGSFIDGRTPGLGPSHFVCHCLLLETDGGLALVDTGVVAQDSDRSAHLLGPVFTTAFNIDLRSSRSAAAQIIRLGHQPGDVKHIVMTHMDFDHAAGLSDFPNATVHLSSVEAGAVRAPAGPKERARYALANAMDQSRWRAYDRFDADCFGLAATALDGLPAVMLLALPGHTRGHCGVAVDRDHGQWLLHAGDAILNAHELGSQPSMPTGARLLQWSLQSSQGQRRRSLAALRRTRRDHPDLTILCTHDPALLPSPA